MICIPIKNGEKEGIIFVVQVGRRMVEKDFGWALIRFGSVWLGFGSVRFRFGVRVRVRGRARVRVRVRVRVRASEGVGFRV